MHFRWPRALVTVALAAVLTGAASPMPEEHGQVSALDWVNCGPDVQCAELTVPVDWADPSGPSTVVDVARVPARDQRNRVGSLVANLGSGNSTGAIVGPRPPVIDEMLRPLTERMDVVVVDPRGIGRTRDHTLIACPDPPASEVGLIEARSEADWQAHIEANAAYDASCRDAAGPEFRGLNSWQAAHDLDALRAALGEDTLRYFGNSYGTAWGQAYADLFGERVETMYLEGVADHTQTELVDWLRNYALTQEQQLLHFRDWCARARDCALSGSDAAQVWDELVAAASREPLPAPGVGEGETVDVGQLFAGALVGMTPPRWPRLAEAMAKARDGDATDFRTALRFPPDPEDEFSSVQTATLCHDFMPSVPTYRELLDIERDLMQVAPRFGWIEGRYEVGRCAGIAGDPAYPPRPPQADGLPPVLIGIGDLDNNTNHLGAAHVAQQLPTAGTLRHGDGHAAYVNGNRCLRKHANAYLTDGTMPPPGTHCPAELTEQRIGG